MVHVEFNSPVFSTLRSSAFAALIAFLTLAGPVTDASAQGADTDLFRTNVPPNILLMVDNSSSMANSVTHRQYDLDIVESGVTKRGKNQTECTFFRDAFGTSKLQVYVQAKRFSYKDANNITMRYRGTPKSWETIPILHPDGSQMYNDIDLSGTQDAGEVDMFYRFPNPAITETAWQVATGNEANPILDINGNQLWWDANGNGIQEAGDRNLYYDVKASGALKGSAAKIVSRLRPVAKAIATGLDPLSLDFLGNNICGVDPSGWTIWDGNDPLAAAPNGKVMQILPQYLDFLFSSFGGVARAAVFMPTVGNDGIRSKNTCMTLIGGESGTYQTFRRSRVQALTTILRTVICEVNQVGSVRFGFAQFRFAGKPGDDNGGYVAVPIQDWFAADGVTPNTYTLHGVNDSHENHLRRVIRTSAPDAQTPLAESLFQLYTYFMSRKVAELPEGRDWEGNLTGVKFPVYNYDTSLYDALAGYDADVDLFPPNLDDVGGRYVGPLPLDPTADADSAAAPDPLLYPCQKNFILFITDGASAGDDFTDNDDNINTKFNPVPLIDTHTDIGYSNFLNLIGDHYRADDLGTPDETETTAGTSTKYMDDVAYFMNRWDFRPDENDMPGEQTIDTYTVGYAVDSGTTGTVSTTEKAALRGNGSYFESGDADELANDIVAAITDMIDKAQAFTSATVPASRTTDGNNFYSSFFLPKDDTGFWEGHLKNFEFSALGDILTPAGKCATGGDINATPPCMGGMLRTFENAFWDAADAIPDPANRKMYVEFGFSPYLDQPYEMNPAAGTEASWALLYNLVEGVDDLQAPYDSLSPSTDIDMMNALHGVLRGCEFGSSPCIPRTNDAGSKIYLGDIFHSNPSVVGSPNAPINEVSYRVFSNLYRQRPRVIYAGANDGFLHGFHAGDWQNFEADGTTPLIPPRHDRGTGEELMAFMPAGVRTQIKELPKKSTFPRGMETADGSPIIADAWFYRDVTAGVMGAKNSLLSPDDLEAARWRTVLLGGLRNGGSSYYALDITDPPSSASVTTSTYPRYLWGFPCDYCGLAVNPNTASETTYMGYTWSEPVITRVRVRADGGTDPRGYDRWVAIFGAGYHPFGDPNGSDYRQVADTGFMPYGRAIYMVDITTGEVLAKKVFDSAASALTSTKTPQVGIKEFHYAFASAPAVFDLDFDGYADVIYIGDLGGNLWKWVVRSVGDDPINNVSADKDMAQPNWPFRRVFRGGTSLEPTLPAEQTGGSYDASVHYQSFFFPPTGVLRQGRLVIAFGAGERANAKGPDAMWGDGVKTNNNHYYVLKDVSPWETGAIDPNAIYDALDEGDLFDLDGPTSLSCSQMQSTTSGYYMTARDAEKFITNSVVFLGTVFTGSFLPPDPANSALICEASGSAFLYAFDLDCGIGLFQSNPGVAIDKRRKAIGSGIPTRPRVSVGQINQGASGGGGGGGGCTNRVLMITSDGDLSNDCPGTASSSGVGIRSWRER